MKVLFLDIDGVLNREGTKERCEGFIGCDRVLAKMLTDWLVDKDLQVVLSSSWRTTPSMWSHLNEAGITWVDITPKIPGANRGLEIALWLDEHLDVTHFAILDDNCDMQPLGRHLVQTSHKYGLRERNLKALDKLLGYDKITPPT